MKVTTTLAIVGGLCAALGCKGKQEEPAPATTAPPEPGSAAPTPTGSAEPAPTGSAEPAPAAGSGMADPGATHGACDVTATGAIDFVSHIENEPTAVLSDYWLSAATKAASAKLRAEAEGRGETYRMPEQPLQIVCHDVARGLFIRFAPTFSKLADIKQAPQDFPIAKNPQDKPGVMRAEVTMRDGGISVVAGGLHVTKWEQGEIAATFELQIETFDEPPKKAKLAGTLLYHCASYPQCGAK